MTTELKKARAFVIDRNNSIKETAIETGISEAAISLYRSHPSRLERATWKNVHSLALQFDKRKK